jgi:hypothetical protein
MPEATRNRPEVDASGEQLGRRVVPQGVKVAVESERGAHPAVSVSHGTGIRGSRYIRLPVSGSSPA